MSKPKTLVNKATTDDRTPPSGYILQELAQKSHSIAECNEIESLVLKKLSKNKPYVKKKALRIVKYMCDNGSPQWKRAWQRHTDKLKECQQYRGPPDQVYGDSPYKEVREAAKQAMQAVFAVTQMDNSQLRNRIRGLDGTPQAYSSSGAVKQKASFGSGSQGVYSGPSSNRGPRGPAPNRNRNISTEATGNTKYKPTTRKQPFEPLGKKEGYNPAHFSHKNPYSQGKLDNRTNRGTAKRKKKTAGGVWADDNGGDNGGDEYDEDSDGGYGDNETFPGNESSTNKGTFGRARNELGNKKKAVRSDGRFEKKWVDDITKGSGIGIKIVKSELTKYVQQFENLSQDHVLEYLDEKLISTDNWKEQGKALTLIEALLNGSSQSNVEEYFQQSPDNLQFLIEEGKAILKKKARSIIELIGVEDENEEDEEEEDINDNYNASMNDVNTSNQDNSNATQEKQADLLDFMATAADTTADTGGDNLLDGLETVEDTGDADGVGNMFDNLNLDDGNTQQQQTQNTGSSLLPSGNITNNNSNANNNNNISNQQQQGSLLLPTGNDVTVSTSSQAKKEASGGLEDIFAGLGNTQQDSNITNILSGSQQQAQATGQQSGGFSFVNNVSNGNQNVANGNNNGAAAAAAQGSSFNFIANQGQAQAQPQTQPQSQQATQQSNQGGFSFVQQQQQTQAPQQGGMQSMNQLRNQTQQNVSMMNQMLNNMNQVQNMMNQAQNMNSMNSMNSMNAMNNMQGMNSMGGMNNMNNMNNMNAMNNMGNMGNMGMNAMSQMGNNQMGNMGFGGMNNMNAMNAMNMNSMNQMGNMGGMSQMSGMQGTDQQNTSGMNAMMMNNMNNFTGLATTLNQHHPLNQMRQNDPFAAVMSGGPTPSAMTSSAQTQPKKQKDLFKDFDLKNLA